MTPEPISQRMAGLLTTVGPLFQFFTASTWARRQDEAGIADFVVGNPHELPLPAFADALARWSAPQHKNWFAYPFSHPVAQALIARTLRTRYELPFEAEDILLTNGAFAAIAVALATVVDPGDEVIFISPPWFFYEVMIAGSGARPVRVKAQPPAAQARLSRGGIARYGLPATLA